jgi:hypothetical protein
LDGKVDLGLGRAAAVADQQADGQRVRDADSDKE